MLGIRTRQSQMDKSVSEDWLEANLVAMDIWVVS